MQIVNATKKARVEGYDEQIILEKKLANSYSYYCNNLSGVEQINTIAKRAWVFQKAGQRSVNASAEESILL